MPPRSLRDARVHLTHKGEEAGGGGCEPGRDIAPLHTRAMRNAPRGTFEVLSQLHGGVCFVGLPRLLHRGAGGAQSAITGNVANCNVQGNSHTNQHLLHVPLCASTSPHAESRPTLSLSGSGSSFRAVLLTCNNTTVHCIHQYSRGFDLVLILLHKAHNK